jgi:hypothetical protein
MPDYQKGKIYRLWSPSQNIIYIGSTTQVLSQRLGGHLKEKRTYDKDNTKKYITSFLVLDCEDYKIELLEEYACNNKQQLEKKESEYIRNNDCINKIIPDRTRKEYYNDNIDRLKEQFKQYRIDNIENIRARENKYYQDNKDKISERRKQRYLNKKTEKS